MSGTKIKCKVCNRELKKSSLAGHMKNVHGDKPDVLVPDEPEFIVNGPQLCGEIGRLEWLQRHDPDQDWAGVYHGYVKVSGQADTQQERNDLRKQVNANRIAGRW